VVATGIALVGMNSSSGADRRAGGKHEEIFEQAEQNREKFKMGISRRPNLHQAVEGAKARGTNC